MSNMLTLADGEAVANEDYGYMHRDSLPPYMCVIIGDKIAEWSTNTLDNGVSVS